MMRAIILGLLAALSVVGVASADDKADIQALNDAFSAAAHNGDSAAMAALYAPDAVMLPPDNSMVSGPAAIGAYLAGLEKGAANLKLTTTDVVRISPDFIREVGVASFDTVGEKPVQMKGTYVVVWKRVGGTWKLWTDIFH
jgi:uncharacterized protein (TIGR02246 family)